MSGRKRKNAGEGYGYMFHGSFKKKADAAAKERKTKGAWIKPTLTNAGYRYIVMSPRTNPIKRKKKAPKESKGEMLKRRLRELDGYAPRVAPAKNPSELLVMGANPHENVQEIVLQPGSRLMIRNNPEPRENLYLGFGASHPSRAELRESRRGFKTRVRRRTAENREEYTRLRKSARRSFKGKNKLNDLFHEVYGPQDNPAPICGAMIGGEPCSRKPGHRGPHLPQGATMRTRTRLPRHWQPRGNPSAEALRERFTGKAVDRISVHEEPHMPAGDYAKLGNLLALYVKPMRGGQVETITMSSVKVVSDERGAAEPGKLGPIWFVGGDQDITDALAVFGAVERGNGLYEIGQATRIDYKQRKEHVPDPESDAWRHSFGEENDIRPVALFDLRSKRILLEGGDYRIREEGIVN